MTCYEGTSEEFAGMKALITGFCVILWILFYGIVARGWEILGLRFIPLIFSSAKLYGEGIWRMLSGNTRGTGYWVISNLAAVVLSSLMILLLN